MSRSLLLYVGLNTCGVLVSDVMVEALGGAG